MTAVVEATVVGAVKAQLEFEVEGGFSLPVSDKYFNSVKDHIGQRVTLNGYIRPNEEGVMTLFPDPTDD